MMTSHFLRHSSIFFIELRPILGAQAPGILLNYKKF